MANKLKRVSGYQTTDGKMFTPEQKKEAREHQDAIHVTEGLQHIADRMDTNPVYYNDDAGCNAIVSSFLLAHFILDNAEDIKLALAGKFEIPEVAPVVSAEVLVGEVPEEIELPD